jgi:protocatechuate 3,4-dioxygenase beta subunit
MDNDDIPVGRLLSRREALKLLAAASTAMLAGCGPGEAGITQSTTVTGQAATTAVSEAATAGLNAEAGTAVASAVADPGLNATADTAAAATALPACVVSPEQTEGPYYADVQLDRSDIRSDPGTGKVKEGLPLHLTMRVSNVSASGCAPLQGATVEIWHCDALGVYSAFEGEGTANEKFLRGHQTTDASGAARFTTIYPGWYRGRTIHIHFKVHTQGTAGGNYEFTSQMYFDDAISDRVLEQAPYTGHSGERDTTNASDGIYGDGGDQLTVALAQAAQGYTGELHIGLDLSDPSAGANDSGQGGGPGGPGGPRPGEPGLPPPRDAQQSG